MWQRKRIVGGRGNSRKKRFILILVILIFLISLTFAVFRYVKKPVLISPLPISQTRPDALDGVKKALAGQHISFTSVEIATDSSYIVHLDKGEEVFFSNSKNIASQVASLQLIRSQLTIEGKGFKRLDLRFENPIIISVADK